MVAEEINFLIDKIKNDQKAQIIAIIVAFVILVCTAIFCISLCNFMCKKDDDVVEAMELDEN